MHWLMFLNLSGLYPCRTVYFETDVCLPELESENIKKLHTGSHNDVIIPLRWGYKCYCVDCVESLDDCIEVRWCDGGLRVHKSGCVW